MFSGRAGTDRRFNATSRFLVLAAFSLPRLIPQPVFTSVFRPSEFAARRTEVMKAIGNTVAILQGTTERPGEQPFRQSNQFFYLTGVAEPRAILVIDGRERRSTLFLKDREERREKMMFGPGLYAGPEAARATGVDAVLSRMALPCTRLFVRKFSGRRRRATPSLWRERRRTMSGTAAALEKRRSVKN